MNIYKEIPPFINGRTPESLADSLSAVLSDDVGRRKLGEKARAWITQHHAGSDTAKIQISAYERYLANCESSSNSVAQE